MHTANRGDARNERSSDRECLTINDTRATVLAIIQASRRRERRQDRKLRRLLRYHASANRAAGVLAPRTGDQPQ